MPLHASWVKTLPPPHDSVISIRWAFLKTPILKRLNVKDPTSSDATKFYKGQKPLHPLDDGGAFSRMPTKILGTPQVPTMLGGSFKNGDPFNEPMTQAGKKVTLHLKYKD